MYNLNQLISSMCGLFAFGLLVGGQLAWMSARKKLRKIVNDRTCMYMTELESKDDDLAEVIKLKAALTEAKWTYEVVIGEKYVSR